MLSTFWESELVFSLTVSFDAGLNGLVRLARNVGTNSMFGNVPVCVFVGHRLRVAVQPLTDCRTHQKLRLKHFQLLTLVEDA